MHDNLVEQAFASTRAAMRDEHATPDACAAEMAATFCTALDHAHSSQRAAPAVRADSPRAQRHGLSAEMQAWAGAQQVDGDSDGDGGYRGTLLADWVEQQHALFVLGLLPPPRVSALMATLSNACGNDAAMHGCYVCNGPTQPMHESHAHGYHLPQSSPDCICPDASMHAATSPLPGGGTQSRSDVLRVLRAAHGVLAEQSSVGSSAADGGAGADSDAWGRGIAQLMWYRRRHGDVAVPLLGEHEDLATWLEDVKARRSTLRPQQVAQLWSLGVPLHLRTEPHA